MILKKKYDELCNRDLKPLKLSRSQLFEKNDLLKTVLTNLKPIENKNKYSFHKNAPTIDSEHSK